MANNFKIKQKPTIKILGSYVSNDLKIDNHLNNILKQCYNRIHMLKRITKYTDFNTRLKFSNAHVMGKLNYMLPLLSSTNKTQLKKVHKLVMFAARTVHGHYCYKTSIKNILSKLGWMSANQLIQWSSLKFIHKIIFSQQPNSLYNHFKINKRKCAAIVPKKFPKSNFSKNICVNKSLETYNKLPTDLKILVPKKFKLKGAKYVKSNFAVN